MIINNNSMSLVAAVCQNIDVIFFNYYYYNNIYYFIYLCGAYIHTKYVSVADEDCIRLGKIA